MLLVPDKLLNYSFNFNVFKTQNIHNLDLKLINKLPVIRFNNQTNLLKFDT